MIKPGDYKILQILNVSKSKASQLLGTSPDLEDVFKCLAVKGDISTVIYFVENVDFGKDSTIRIIKTIINPLLFKGDYEVIERFPFKDDHEFVKKLLN